MSSTEKICIQPVIKASWLPLVIIISIVAIHLQIGPLTLTGDEPEYLFGSVQIWLGHNLSLDPTIWVQWLHDNQIATDLKATNNNHSIVHAALLAPIIGSFGLQAGRWFQLVLVLIVSGLYLSATPEALKKSVTPWLFLYLISIPVLPYLALIYPEAWLFLVVSIIMILIAQDRLSEFQHYVAVLAVIFLPFLHIRSAMVSAVFGAYFFVRFWLAKNASLRMRVVTALFVTVSIPVFVYYQIQISGKLAGSASFAYTPSLTDLLDRFGLQAFGYRHGLFVYCPIALLGVAGLILGTIKRQKPFGVYLLAFVAYVLTFIWGTASESYSGRFWVMTIPLLIYGSIYWFQQSQRVEKWIIFSPLLALTLFNSVSFILNPAGSLENRFGSISYDRLDRFTHHIFNVNLITAIDVINVGGIVILNHQNTLIGGLIILLILGLAGVGLTQKSWRLGSTLLVYGLVLFASYQCRMVPIKSQHYDLTRHEDGTGLTYIRVRFDRPIVVHGFKFGSYEEDPDWGTKSDKPKYYVVDGLDQNNQAMPAQKVSGFQLTRLTHAQAYSELIISADTNKRGKDWMYHHELLLF
jgi:hypothetical protein